MGLTVEKLVDGTVIDHIEAGKGILVFKILNIDENYEGKVALVMNVPSKRMKKKDIVKIAGLHVDEKTANKIALISPKATFNLIEKSKVVEKKKVKLPDILVGIAKCPNPVCITNHEKGVETEFLKSNGNTLRCAYCEKSFELEEIKV